MSADSRDTETRRSVEMSGDEVKASSGNSGENQREKTTLETEDDVIPNAIVIKNIPFAIKKEQLLDIIAGMGLPLPYAFNYHFDNGVFRGLAFANFTTPDETVEVIQQLNGRDISGRKLKVEYKKILPQAERERIEREKREKRGQLEEQHRSISNLSLQSLGKMGGSQQNSTNAAATSNNSASAGPSNTSTAFNFLPEAISTHNNSTFSALGSPAANSTGNVTTAGSSLAVASGNSQASTSLFNNSTLPENPQYGRQHLLSSQHSQTSLYSNTLANVSSSTPLDRYYAPLPSTSSMPLPPQQVDFNDPDTLEIFSQLLLFRDRERQYQDMVYPSGVAANFKRIITILCSYLGLQEVHDQRFIIIKRRVLDGSTLQSHLKQQDQLSSSNQLQPNSTGGSLSRSHSYTSLLQVHASANNNTNAVNLNNATTPKMGTQSQFGYAPTSAGVISQSQFNNGASLNSPSQTSNNVLFSTDQPQQTFLRQQNAIAGSSRIPSGYQSNNNQLSFVNSLLRNNGISPPSAQGTLNTGSQVGSHAVTPPSNTVSQQTNQSQSKQHVRVPSSLQMTATQTSSGQLFEPPLSAISNQSSNGQVLLAQNTNGSAHSNYSMLSIHDENLPSNNEMIYRTSSLHMSRLDDGLEQGLHRSLSGLDLNGKPTNANSGNVNDFNDNSKIW